MTNSVSKEYYTAHHVSSIGIFDITDVHRHALEALSLTSGNRVIDFGCGDGELISLITKSGAQAAGIDYAHDSVEMGKAHVPEAAIIEGDITALTFPDAAFDRAASLGTLGYLSKEDLARHFSEASRVLSSGGLYIIR